MVYCTPLEVKQEAQVKHTQLDFDTDSDYVGHIQNTLIPMAQKIIDNFVGHNFENNSGTLNLDGSGQNILMIPPPNVPVTAITSVEIDDVDVTSSIKFYDSYIAIEGGTFTKNESNLQNVEIVLTYGYSEVPADVKYICARLVANHLIERVRKKMMPDLIAQTLQADSGTGLTVSMRGHKVFTDELKEMLRPYVFSFMDVS